MSTQTKSVDKINMSLDEIIKMNRTQVRKNKFDANRKLNKENAPSNQTFKSKVDTSMSLDEIIKLNKVKKMPNKFVKTSNQVGRPYFKKNENKQRRFGMPQQQPNKLPKSFQKNNKFQAKRGVKQQTNNAARQFNRFLDR